MSVKSVALLAALVACGVVGTASANSGQNWKFNADTPAEFEQQASKVRDGMKESGQYAGISTSDRHAVEVDLDKISDLLKRKGSGSVLSGGEQVELANAQERVNAILTRNDGDRLVCTFERRSGSNFKYKTCMTVSDRDRERRKSQEGFQNAILKGGGSQAPGN